MDSSSSIDTSLSQFRYEGKAFAVEENDLLYITYQNFRGNDNLLSGYFDSLRIKRDTVYADESWVVYSKDGKALITCLKKKELINYKVKEGTLFICDDAFDCCDNLKEIIIPDSVQAIGKNAFWGCSSLLNIELPRHLDVIQARTFSGCRKLSYISMPESLKRIEECAFVFCDSLCFVFMAQNIKYVAPTAFESNKYIPIKIIVPNLTYDYYSKLLNGLEVKIQTIEDFNEEQDSIKQRNIKLIPKKWSEIIGLVICTIIGLVVMYLINLLKGCM